MTAELIAGPEAEQRELVLTQFDHDDAWRLGLLLVQSKSNIVARFDDSSCLVGVKPRLVDDDRALGSAERAGNVRSDFEKDSHKFGRT